MQKITITRTVIVALAVFALVFSVTAPSAYSNITIPSFDVPVITAPTVTVPVVTTPTVTTPTITTPTITVPEVTTPTVTVPEVTVPTVIPPTVTPPTTTSSDYNYAFCKIKADRTSVGSGESVTVTWETDGFATITINGESVSGKTGSKTYTNITTNRFFKLEAVSADGKSTCKAQVSVACIPPVVTPVCTLTASKNLITKGEQVALTWTTDNATAVSIDRGIGNVALDGTTNVAPTETTTYTLTAAKDGKQVQCPVIITVKDTPEEPAPRCDAFTATPNSFNNGVGGAVTLAWQTSNASAVSIDNGVGTVEADGSKQLNVAANTTFILTATGNGKTVSCPVSVTITKPETPVLRCDSFTASPNSLRRGERTTLTWDTTGATEVTINNGVGTVALDGNTSVVVNDDTQYTLIAKDAKGNTVSCDANVSITTGGGGGGSSSPRCDLNISDTKVKAGEKVTISWRNSRVNEMILKDNRGTVLVDTEDDSKFDEDTGEIVVRPTRDTEYTMTVSRGSKDRTCRVKVDVTDGVTVIENRTQTPLVAGISLSQVPYTGFEAGPFMTLLFYTILGAWAAFVAYLLVVRERTVLGFSLARANGKAPMNPAVAVIEETPAAPMAETPIVARTATFPANLPMVELNSKSGNPIFGYQSFMTDTTDVEAENEIVIEEETETNALEAAAHAQSTLLSSDAIAYFMNAHDAQEDRVAALAKVIAVAKAQYPSEGGWLVLNRQRVDALTTPVATPVSFIPQTITGASSLAEAIATGNVTAAYELIGNRPMFALADAAADFDGIVRVRKGMDANPSQLLLDSTVSLNDTQVEAIVAALTGALDGAYNDEAHAVKMAIMKAIRVVG